MMMTHSYYGSEFDPLARSNQRASINAGHYSRPSAYEHSYYDVQRELRSDYDGRPGADTLIHEHSSENTQAGHSRRRIQVACSRCRRRKIKCTGDPGDGSGCSACRSAQADKATCTFNRVGSQEVPLPGLEVLPTSGSRSSMSSATPTTASYPSDSSSNSHGIASAHTDGAQRTSLPILHTRTAYPEYDSYNTSPADEYTYASATIPRHDSVASTYGAESFRPYTTGSLSAPSANTNVFYEPVAAYSFGSLHTAPGYQPGTPMTRLPSVTADNFSPLNMSSLHSSLPTQTVQERRLPVPYTPQQPTYTAAEIPYIRPLTSLTEPQRRAQIGGIYSRNSMSWSTASPTVTRATSRSSVATPAPHGLPVMAAAARESAQTPAPTFGYQFSASSVSPEPPSASSASLSESFHGNSSSGIASASMPPPATLRYGPGGAPVSMSASSEGAEPRRASSSHETSASLYSFSGGIEAAGRSTPARSTGHNSIDTSSAVVYPQGYAQVRHTQPQHAASVDELRRRSSYDHQQRAASSHRMSVSNLNTRY